jgi:hypothetical protein
MPSPSSLTWVSGPTTPQVVYLTRLWNFGTWEEWQQARRKYSAAEMEEAVKRPLRGQWTRHGKAFAETVCGSRMPDDVLVSYDA